MWDLVNAIKYFFQSMYLINDLIYYLIYQYGLKMCDLINAFNVTIWCEI